jgi:hypothetical protein
MFKNRAPSLFTTVLYALVTIVGVFTCGLSNPVLADTSTPEDRAALFDYILAKTLEREAFSPIKNRRLGLDIEKEMRKYRSELIAADTDEKLFYALVEISNARKDRHLKVSLVEGGLSLPGAVGDDFLIPHAPIRFSVDFSRPGYNFVFVSDYAENIRDYTGDKFPEIGDKLLSINAQPLDEYRKAIEPYHRYSTVEGFWWKFAHWIPQKSHIFPRWFYRENISFFLEKKGGKRYRLELPYLSQDKIIWKELGKPIYPNFSLIFTTQTFDLYQHDQGMPVLLLAWHGFRSDLIKDMDRLMNFAAQNELLDHDIIVDATRSRGGSKGAYAIQRLSPKPFKTTFGNLRLSDIIPAFIERKQAQFRSKKILDSGVMETVDDGTWLMNWLENDVTLGIKAGQSYSNNVPFKLAHLPKYSDGIVKPARIHFRGRLVCWFSPYGGSHLDQFASIVVDNNLAHTMGMSAGGYSNTWEWEETLIFPLSKKPVVLFMWSIGHTIRPNGEILEGNPAKVAEHIPLTRENCKSYYSLLLSRSLSYLGIE